jgi:protein TonB
MNRTGSFICLIGKKQGTWKGARFRPPEVVVIGGGPCKTEGKVMQTQNFLFVKDAEPAARQEAHVVLPPPKVEPLHEVFAEAMLEDTSSHQRRSPFDWVAAIGVHFAVLAVLLILPLYFTSGLDFKKLNLTFLATPVMPAAPPPPILSAAARPARISPIRNFTPGLLTAPSFIPKAVAAGPASAAAPLDDSMMGVAGGIPGGQAGGILGGVLGGELKGVPPPAAPVVAGPKVPLRIGGNVKAPRLLFGPDPMYPLLAKQAHIGGIVVIEAVIDEQGNVTGMRVISGHPILIPAALTAVSKRKYEPTVLDGEPMPIDLRVEVTFSFS